MERYYFQPEINDRVLIVCFTHELRVCQQDTIIFPRKIPILRVPKRITDKIFEFLMIWSRGASVPTNEEVSKITIDTVLGNRFLNLWWLRATMRVFPGWRWSILIFDFFSSSSLCSMSKIWILRITDSFLFSILFNLRSHSLVSTTSPVISPYSQSLRFCDCSFDSSVLVHSGGNDS